MAPPLPVSVTAVEPDMAERVRMPVLDLDDQSWAVLADAVGELEQSWQSDAATDIGQLVPTVANPLRRRVLVELVKVDQEFRWERGEQRRVEDYLADWPELGGKDTILVELLEAECLTRAVLDFVPTVEELRSRFPAIHERVNLHQISADAGVEREGLPLTNILPLPLDTSNRSLENTASHAVDKYVLQPGHCLGRYEILELLGRGGMGTVYRAHDTHLKREVALKIPRFDAKSDPDAVARFVREAEAAAQINHPNVCTIYDAGEVDGTYYITMRLVHGPSLASWIKDRQLDLRQTASIVSKLATALAGVHDKGIVHRDIKPSNVMMDESGEPLLMDFGLARPTDVDRFLTSSGAVLGTLPYMSPQQVDGEPADCRSDIYSLGVLLYQMLTGRLPFTGKLTAMMLKIAEAQPPRPSKLRPDVDAELEGICLKAMAKSPADRYQSVAEMADALKHYLAKLPQATCPSARRRRFWTTTTACVIVVLTLFAAAVIYLKTGTGTLEFEVPADATVKIDGQVVEVQSTVGTVRVSIGKHELRVTQAGERLANLSFRIRWRGECVKRTIPIPHDTTTPTQMSVIAAPTRTAAIHGRVWHDLDGDGDLDRGPEPTLQGWKIFLDNNQNGSFDEWEPHDITEALYGRYCFTDLAPGTYRVTQVLQQGWEQTQPECSPISYETDFSEDVHWSTNRPADFFWHPRDGTYSLTQTNINRGGGYAYHDAGYNAGSFSLEWDIKILSNDYASGVLFGLFDDDLNAEDNGSYAAVLFTKEDRGHTVILHCRDSTNKSRFAVSDRRFSCGTWYHVIMKYDVRTHILTANVRTRESGNPIASLTITDLGVFSEAMGRIGSSNVREGDFQVPGAQSSATLDNVTYSSVGVRAHTVKLESGQMVKDVNFGNRMRQ